MSISGTDYSVVMQATDRIGFTRRNGLQEMEVAVIKGDMYSNAGLLLFLIWKMVNEWKYPMVDADVIWDSFILLHVL